MPRTSKPIAVFLLAMAVLCSPAGVCVIDGMAATVQTAAPAHAHACCKSGDGAFLVASDGTCCSESRAGFLNVFRFSLERQTTLLALEPGLVSAAPARSVKLPDVERRAPLVLRI
jgi:hypothetical protein